VEVAEQKAEINLDEIVTAKKARDEILIRVGGRTNHRMLRTDGSGGLAYLLTRLVL